MVGMAGKARKGKDNLHVFLVTQILSSAPAAALDIVITNQHGAIRGYQSPAEMAVAVIMAAVKHQPEVMASLTLEAVVEAALL